MKKIILMIAVLSFAAVNAGCQNAKSRAAEGAVIGGVLGAAAGGIIGHQSHSGGAGAGIGAAVGALSGAVIGAQIEKKPAGESAPSQPVTVASTSEAQMSVLQVIELSKSGATENIIIDKIKKSNSKFNLTPEDVDYLKKEGVSQNIINAMQGV